MKRMILGVGNRLSRDDGSGPVVVDLLRGSDWIALDCGTALENAVGVVRREDPDLLVVVDAADMGAAPGTVRRLAISCHQRMLATTHGLPLGFVLTRLRDTVGRVVLVGVQPADLSWGEGLSPEIERAVRGLVSTLRHGCVDDIPPLSSE